MWTILQTFLAWFLCSRATFTYSFLLFIWIQSMYIFNILLKLFYTCLQQDWKCTLVCFTIFVTYTKKDRKYTYFDKTFRYFLTLFLCRQMTWLWHWWYQNLFFDSLESQLHNWACRIVGVFCLKDNKKKIRNFPFLKRWKNKNIFF